VIVSLAHEVTLSAKTEKCMQLLNVLNRNLKSGQQQFPRFHFEWFCWYT